jgi:hypothetical protein
MRYLGFGLLLGAAVLVLRAEDFTADEMKMLRDAGGWEYITISNPTGFQTKHPCFDGRPHPETCRGTLFFKPDDQFVKNIYVNNLRDQRTGGYQLSDKTVIFLDEFGQKDGPYDAKLDAQNKSLTLDKQGAHMELLLEKEYRRQLEQHKKKAANPQQ